ERAVHGRRDRVCHRTFEENHTMSRMFAVASIALLGAVLATACGDKGSADSKGKDKGGPVAANGRVDITVTEKGCEPEKIQVRKGDPVTLVFTRKTDKTCATEVVLDTGAEKIQKALPLNQPVEVAVTFSKSGELKYGCQMDQMIAGYVVVQ